MREDQHPSLSLASWSLIFYLLQLWKAHSTAMPLSSPLNCLCLQCSWDVGSPGRTMGPVMLNKTQSCCSSHTLPLPRYNSSASARYYSQLWWLIQAHLGSEETCRFQLHRDPSAFSFWARSSSEDTSDILTRVTDQQFYVPRKILHTHIKTYTHTHIHKSHDQYIIAK